MDAREEHILREWLGMPADHPRLAELREWSKTWLHEDCVLPASRQAWLNSLPEAARSALIQAISVPESFFYRYPAQLNRVISRTGSHDPARPLRIWSACCAGGEEPYTLAIMLAEAGLLERTRIVATDINQTKLDQARAGEFSERAVRPLPQALKKRWFTRQPGFYAYRIDPFIREAVSFQTLDLLSFARGQVRAPITPTDVILCRNALIYFEKPLQAQLAKALLAASAPGAWLLPGHSERLPAQPPEEVPRWVLRTAKDHVWYSREETAQPSLAANRTRQQRPGPRPAPTRQISKRPAGPLPCRRIERASASAPDTLDSWLETARSAQDAEAVIAACRRVLYLEPNHPEAHWLMIRAALSADQRDLAARHARLLRHVLASLPEQAMLGTDPDMSVGQMRQALDATEGLE